VPFLGGRGDRLLDQHMNAALDTGQRNPMMQMGRRRNGDRIDATLDERLDVGDRGATERIGHEARLLVIRIGNADETNARKIVQHASVVAAHDADANHPHAQQTISAFPCGSHHVRPTPCRYDIVTPARASLAWPGPSEKLSFAQIPNTF
jgi:hypothetical protein